MDLLISFDDTGSMYSVRAQVKQKIEALIDELYQVIPELRIGIIIHNDYCDHDLVQKMDFTSDRGKVNTFIHRNSSKGGGDHREAYAYVLHEMLDFDWRSDDRIAILIGDAPPHEKGSTSYGVMEKYDWKEEVALLRDGGVKTYPIQALDRGRIERAFYQGIADISKTTRLDLSQFQHITQYIMAIVHKTAGSLDEYANSNATFKTNISLKNMFAKLGGTVGEDEEYSSKEGVLGKFQVCSVSLDQRISDFVRDMGVHYNAGRGFYEWTKRETIQKNKQVLFVDKMTGETISDTAKCREMLGLPLGIEGKLAPKDRRSLTEKYDIFIQSTSYTRKLKGGTKFLYELNAF